MSIREVSRDRIVRAVAVPQPSPQEVRARTRTILVLTLAALAFLAWAGGASGMEPGATSTAVADSTEWPGLEKIERVVRTRVAELWRVPADDLVLEFGVVRTEWIPGDDLVVDLLGTGRGGIWVVSATDAAGGVSLRLRAGRSVLRLAAARPLARGEVVTGTDMTLRRVTVWGNEETAEPADPTGWVVRRRIDAGEALEPPAVEPPAAVTTGAAVRIELRLGSVGITMGGTALGTVPVGSQVHVRTDSGERLRGTAIAPGRVRVLQMNR